MELLQLLELFDSYMVWTTLGQYFVDGWFNVDIHTLTHGHSSHRFNVGLVY